MKRQISDGEIDIIITKNAIKSETKYKYEIKITNKACKAGF